jgi:DNA-directed RNA polymerase subunit RPC12/RpoP
MSIRIVKEGKIPPKPVYEATCSHCSTEFEYNLEDLSLVRTYYVKLARVSCPTCGSYVLHNHDKQRK